jgi:hypothetical protein
LNKINVFGLLLTFGFLSFSCLGQTTKFRFKIVDGSNGKSIKSGIISYEDSLGNLLKYTKIDSNFIKDDVPKQSLKISINSIEYHTYTENIRFPFPGLRTFYMKRDTSYQLNEVVVVAKNYNYLPDTVSLKVKDLRMASDVKIEDVLKRFPGIKVDASGQIYYRNKPVETVLLDGENLMESNYKLATQNINVGEIDEIEAYDHFSENSIIASLGSSTLTAINLKYTRKFSYTQSGNLGTGIVDQDLNGYILNSNSIINTKIVKTFALFSSNNIGENKSAINYSDYRDMSPLYENLPAFPMSYGGTFPNEGKLKLNRNNQLSGTLNNIFKLHPKLTLKSFSNYLSDDFSNRLSNITHYNFPGNSFSTSDEYGFQTSPQKWGQSFVVKYQASPVLILEGKYYLNSGTIKYRSNQWINQKTGFDSDQNSKIRDYYIEGQSTIKLGKKSAFQLLYQNLSSNNSVNVEMNYSQPLSKQISQVVLQNYQENHLTGKWINVLVPKKLITETWYQYLDLKQELSINSNNPSLLKENGNTIRQEAKGNIYGWVYRGVAEALNLQIKNNGITSNYQKWNTSFDLNSKLLSHPFNVQYANQLNPDYRKYFIKDTLILDSRNKRIDSLQTNFATTEKWNLIISNPNSSHFQYQFGYNYVMSNGNFYSNSILSDYFSIQKNQWQNYLSIQTAINAELGYYLKPIAVNLKLIGSHSTFRFTNSINNGPFRDNLSTTDELTINAKSGYLKAFNFYEAFSIGKNSFENQYSSFTNTTFKNLLQLYFKKNKWKSFVQINSYQFYSGEKFLHFINAGFEIMSRNQKIIYTLDAQNMLNIKDRSFISINDYSRTEYKNFLIGCTILLKVEFSL